MLQLIDTLAAELERPRELSARVLNYIIGTYNVDHDTVGAFLVDELPKLDDDDVDLILSPVFTPKLEDQAAAAAVLVGDHVAKEQLPGIVQQLVERPTIARLLTLDGQTHRVPLREVTVERYVHRLRLEGGIPEPLLALLDQASSTATEERPLLYALARRAALDSEGARQIFMRYLTKAPERGGYRLADALDLLNLMETRKPANLADLMERMPPWQKTLREQVDAGGGPNKFFMEEIRMMHGGDRDQRQQSPVSLTAKEKDLDFLIRLERILS